MENTHSRNKDITCDSQVYKEILGELKLDANYALVNKYGHEFKRSLQQQFEEKLGVDQVRIIELMEGSIIVIFELMDHEDPLLMSKMDLFILETQTSGVTFTFRDEKLPVMKDSITMDVVYVKKEHVEDSWILEGHNLILVIALPVAFFVLFVFIVIVGVCCCRAKKSHQFSYSGSLVNSETESVHSQKVQNTAYQNPGYDTVEIGGDAKVREVGEVNVDMSADN